MERDHLEDLGTDDGRILMCSRTKCSRKYLGHKGESVSEKFRMPRDEEFRDL
jgi:hypothetical protein